MALKISTILRQYPLRFSAFAAVVFMMTATSTHAGFEWIPSKDKPAEQSEEALVPVSPPALVEVAPMADPSMMPPAQNLLAPMPEQIVEPPMPKDQTLQAPPGAMPVIQTKRFDTQNPAPFIEGVPPRMMPPLPPSATVPAPFVEGLPPQHIMPPLPPSAAMPAPIINYDITDGFGNDVPLAIALTEIVPASYAYAFGDNVNAGERVSWTGGKPWPDTLVDMIMPLGLKIDVQGRMVVIRRTGAPSMQMAPEKKNIESLSPADKGAPQKQDAPAAKNQQLDIYDVRRQIINDPGTNRTNQPAQTLEMIKETTTSTESMPAQPKIIPPAEDLDPLPGMTQNETSVPTQPDDVTADILREMAIPAKDIEENEKQNSMQKPAILSKKEPIKAEGPTSPKALPPTFSDLPKPLLAETDQAVAAVVAEAKMPQDSELSAAPSQKGLWEAQKGDSLRRTLDSWSRKANIELVWESSHDYTIESNVMVSGDIQRALKMVFSQGLSAEKAPLMTFIEQSGTQRGKVIIQDDSAG